MKQINHKLFGNLKYNMYYWEGKITIPMFKKNQQIKLSVDGGEDAHFSDIQEEAFLNFRHEITSIMAKVEEGIYEYYQANFEEYREMVGNQQEADEIAPIIDSAGDLEKVVKLTELIVRREGKGGKRRLGLLFHATWDIDNGVGVKVENEIVEEVDYQDIVL
ncbi:hypothetical protein ABEY69_25130 [Priestia filamentosa]|uniref:DUF6985 domain-containing protein n=1 Tax=Priestia filamentosa TaxID=1402861 RepID=UPI003D2B3255